MPSGGLRTTGEIKKKTFDRPLVSIITVVFNGEKHIEKSIASVLNQTYSNIEYIVIDGGSTDRTIDLIKKFENKIDLWISEPDNGIADAFNKGIAQAQGEIIGIINSDDWYELNTVSLVVDSLKQGDVIYGNMQCWRTDIKDYVFMANHKYISREMSINHPTVFVKKSIYDKWGCYNPDYKIAMDYEFFLRLYCNKVKFYYLNQVLANMRLEGISNKSYIKGYNEVRTAKNKYMGNNVLNYLYYLKQILTTTLPQILNKSGMGFVVEFYRNYFSAIRKTRL